MHLPLAVLCIAAVAAAKPQYSYRDDASPAVTTVTERQFTVQGDADKYYCANKYYGADKYYGGYLSGYYAPSRSYYQSAPSVHYHQQHALVHAAPAAAAVTYETATAAPAVAYHAPASVTYHTATAAPAVAYHAPASVTYHTATAAPAVTYHAPAAVPAYHSVHTVATPVAYQAPSVAIQSEGVHYDDTVYQHAAEPETRVFKHVYAFAAPEEPATRAHVSIQAPVNKRKHYKLIFIKAPSHQTVLDSDITLPAQEEEKTLIYVLSKNQKQAQPQIRIKQAEASKHAKPDVFFVKYKNEVDAQAIASGAISGATSGVPANGEIISDGSVSLLGQPQPVVYDAYRGVNQYSVGAIGVVPTAGPTVVSSTPVVPITPVHTHVAHASPSVTVIDNGYAAPVSHSINYAAEAPAYGAYRSSGYAAAEPANVAIKVTTEPSVAIDPVSADPDEKK